MATSALATITAANAVSIPVDWTRVPSVAASGLTDREVRYVIHAWLDHALNDTYACEGSRAFAREWGYMPPKTDDFYSPDERAACWRLFQKAKRADNALWFGRRNKDSRAKARRFVKAVDAYMTARARRAGVIY